MFKKIVLIFCFCFLSSCSSFLGLRLTPITEKDNPMQEACRITTEKTNTVLCSFPVGVRLDGRQKIRYSFTSREAKTLKEAKYLTKEILEIFLESLKNNPEFDPSVDPRVLVRNIEICIHLPTVLGGEGEDTFVSFVFGSEGTYSFDKPLKENPLSSNTFHCCSAEHLLSLPPKKGERPQIK